MWLTGNKILITSVFLILLISGCTQAENKITSDVEKGNMNSTIAADKLLFFLDNNPSL